MRILDATTPRKYVRPSMLLQGVTGSGKSTWACTGGAPLVILTEPKAESVLQAVNPNAMGIVPESLDDLDKLLEILGQEDRIKARNVDRIILDSYTELTHAIPRWIRARNGLAGVSQRIELSHYGDLRDYALAVVRAIQLTGYPSVIIARSTSKRVGLEDRIVPDGTGKSIEELPGKLLPTAEARFDDELGWVIDTTPSEHSQRCGLPWVPPIYTGSCLDYLALVERGPQQVDATALAAPLPAPAPERKPNARERKVKVEDIPPVPPPPSEPDAEWVSLLVTFGESLPKETTVADRKTLVAEWESLAAKDLKAAKKALQEYLAAPPVTRGEPVPDPEVDPTGYQQAFSEVCTTQQAEKQAAKPAPSQQAIDFVEAVSPTLAKAEDITALLDLAREHKANTDALWAYAVSKGGAPAGAKCPNWNQLGAAFVASATLNLSNPEKRRAFLPWLHKTHGKA